MVDYGIFVIDCASERMLIKCLKYLENIFKVIYSRISFYCNILDRLPSKPKFTFRNLKKGVQEFHIESLF